MAERARCEICDREFKDADGLAMHNSAKHSVQEQTKKSKKPLFIIIFIAVLIIGGYFLINGNLTGNSVNSKDNIQKITLSFRNTPIWDIT